VAGKKNAKRLCEVLYEVSRKTSLEGKKKKKKKNQTPPSLYNILGILLFFVLPFLLFSYSHCVHIVVSHSKKYPPPQIIKNTKKILYFTVCFTSLHFTSYPSLYMYEYDKKIKKINETNQSSYSTNNKQL